jgi:hypothetical protein
MKGDGDALVHATTIGPYNIPTTFSRMVPRDIIIRAKAWGQNAERTNI